MQFKRGGAVLSAATGKGRLLNVTPGLRACEQLPVPTLNELQNQSRTAHVEKTFCSSLALITPVLILPKTNCVFAKGRLVPRVVDSLVGVCTTKKVGSS